MIKPHTQTHYKCTLCKWRKIVVPESDALMRGIDAFEFCPKCGNKDLEVKHRNRSIAAEIVDYFLGS